MYCKYLDYSSFYLDATPGPGSYEPKDDSTSVQLPFGKTQRFSDSSGEIAYTLAQTTKLSSYMAQISA